MLDIANDIQSLSTFKRDSAKVMKRLKKTGKPVILTVNGKAEVVVQDAAAYQRLLEEFARLERDEMRLFLEQARADVDAGRTRPADEVFAEFGEKAVTFAVHVARIADIDIGIHYSQIAQWSQVAAERWRIGVWTVIRSLATLPERCPEAPETEWYGRVLRETYHGRRRNTYRILFEIRGQTVYVVRVRHGRQDLLQPGEI